MRLKSRLDATHKLKLEAVDNSDARYVWGEEHVGRRNSGLYPITVGLLVLIAQGCTKKPESYPLSSLRVDYQTWNCQQLANEADLLKDALAVAFEQRADDTVAHLRAETNEVIKARTLKKCNA